MKAGRLRHKLRIEKSAKVRGAMGGVEDVWEEFKTVRGDLDFSNSRKVIAARQLNSEVVGVATIRYIPFVTADMRINHNGTIYEMEAPINVRGRNRELQIPIRTGVGDG